MSGRFTVTPGAMARSGQAGHNSGWAMLEAHDHVVVETEDGARLIFNDARRFGYMDLIPPGEEAASPHLALLGPEPLSDAFNAADFSAAISAKRTPIKAALLDQRLVAGLGNIYVCEALWRAGISPRRLARSVAGARAARLVPAIKDVLTAAIAAGGSSLRDYVQASGELGYFQHAWDAYDREGKPCRKPGCDGVMARIVQSGRSTFFCPAHQR
jgi:formamidopyrimidine-DNA glycosylase